MKLSLACILIVLFFKSSSAGELPFYVGTFTDHAAAKGIYLGHLDSETGKLGPLVLVAAASNPNFFAVSPDHRFLYAVTTTAKNSAVGAYAVKSDGSLKLLNEQPVDAEGACHVSVDRTGHFVFVANYGSGDVACFQINPDGSVGAKTAHVQFTGSGPDKSRQDKAYAHSVYADPENKFVYACDLGSDRVWNFKFDAKSGVLVANDPPTAQVPPGSGPRHLAFSPNGKYVYVANEMGCSVTFFSRDAESGALTAIETISTLPKDVPTHGVTVAEIACHPSGKWLYVSNRGCDTISVFKIAPDGRLSLIQSAASQVKVPRSFTLDPTAHWLIAAGQKDNRLAVFKVDFDTGHLIPTNQSGEVGAPVCVVF